MKQQLYVVDDFYSDPEAVRDLAIHSDYAPKNSYSKNFAGRETLFQFYTEFVIKKFEDLIGGTINVDPAHNAFGRFRMAMGTDARRTRVHLDNTKWAAVVYLTRDEDAQGGTTFFRHSETGLDGAPNDCTLQSMGFRSLAEFDSAIVMRDSLNK